MRAVSLITVVSAAGVARATAQDWAQTESIKDSEYLWPQSRWLTAVSVGQCGTASPYNFSP